MLERKQKIAIRLLITGSGVRIPHNPQDLCVESTLIKLLYLVLVFRANTLLTPLIPQHTRSKVSEALSACSVSI